LAARLLRPPAHVAARPVLPPPNHARPQLLHDPVHCYAASFPKELLTLSASADRERAAPRLARTMRRWWESWSSHPLAPRDNSATDADAPAAAPPPAEGGAPAASASLSSLSSLDAAAGRGPRTAAAVRRAADAAVEAAALRAMDPDFRLFDAYGLYRSMQASPREGRGGGGGAPGRVRGGGRRGMARDAALYYMQR
jgi:hypothetical protein